jgi:O-antigen/teichoic acid export membrane protein
MWAAFRELAARVRASRFVRNTFTLSAGTAVSQAIAILTMPITSRIYGPGPYGVLAAYMSVSVVLSAASTLRLSQAIVLVKEEQDAVSLVGVCIASSVAVGGIAAILAALVSGAFVDWTAEPQLETWIALVPASVVFSGITATSLSGRTDMRPTAQ